MRSSLGAVVSAVRVVVVGAPELIDSLQLPGQLIATPATAHLDVSLRVAQADALVLDGPLERIAEVNGQVPVLALVSESDTLAAIAAGASGALERNSPPEVILAALVALREGLAVFDKSFVKSLVPPADDAPHVDEGQTPTLQAMKIAPDSDELERQPLTAREREVLVLLAEGQSNKQIGRQLHVSEHTAKFHVNAILSKLGAQKRVEAVVRAARLGLIEL